MTMEHRSITTSDLLFQECEISQLFFTCIYIYIYIYIYTGCVCIYYIYIYFFLFVYYAFCLTGIKGMGKREV